MVLCDRLEAQLAISATESRRLLDAVLHEVLGEERQERGTAVYTDEDPDAERGPASSQSV